jgi:PAS domain S-box-containing protein
MSISAYRLPLVFAAVASLGLAAFAGYDLYREHSLWVQHARGSTGNLVRLLEEQVRQSLIRVEDALDDAAAPAVRTVLATEADKAALRRAWRERLPADGTVRGLQLVGEQGRVLVSMPGPGEGPGHASAGTDASASPAVFSAPAASARHKLGIGRLAKGADGKWLLPVGRSLVLSGGGEATLMALVELANLQRVFDSTDTGTNGFVTLFESSGWLLVTSPANEALLSRNWGDAPMFREHLPRATADTLQQVVVRDGTERIYSYRKLADYPLVVTTGVSLTDALAEWRARARWNGILLAGVTLILFGSATAMARARKRRDSAEQALAETAQQTRAIVDHAADGIITFDRHGAIVSVNIAAQSIFGWTEASLLGQDVAKLVPEWGCGDRTPVPKGAAEANGATATAPVLSDAMLSDTRHETKAVRGDGTSLPIEWTVSRTDRLGQEYFIGLVRDISSLKQAQAAAALAREAAERYERFVRDITDSVPIGMAYLDTDLRFQFVNRSSCEHFGLARERVVGRTRQEITGRAVPVALQEQLQLALAGLRASIEVEDEADGRFTVSRIDLVPDVADDGRVRGIYATRTDVTEYRRQQLRIEGALAERETLLREVYHRVKNNLQVVQSLLGMQRRSLSEGAASAALDDSIRRVSAMALVHEKLYKTGTLASVALADYTRTLLRQIGQGAAAAERHVVIRSNVVEVDSKLDVCIPYGLLVTELVGNCLKHAFPAGRGGTVTVTLVWVGAHLELQVADDGVGLPAGFDLDRSLPMGLQLAISLAGQLGGVLRARTVNGAVFSAGLPHLGAPRQEMRDPPQTSEPETIVESL